MTLRVNANPVFIINRLKLNSLLHFFKFIKSNISKMNKVPVLKQFSMNTVIMLMLSVESDFYKDE